MARKRKYNTPEEKEALRMWRREHLARIRERIDYKKVGRPKGGKNKPKEKNPIPTTPTKQIRIYERDRDTLLLIGKRLNKSIAEIIEEVLVKIVERNPELVKPLEEIIM